MSVLYGSVPEIKLDWFGLTLILPMSQPSSTVIAGVTYYVVRRIFNDMPTDNIPVLLLHSNMTEKLQLE